MSRLRVQGMTLRQIGERYGVSPQRVRQLLCVYLGAKDAAALTAAASRARERAHTDALRAGPPKPRTAAKSPVRAGRLHGA
ncbi:MAG: sigma factor-like helix-turn-helix DNA-binding protein [Solirubrobacteraceae bacterium]